LWKHLLDRIDPEVKLHVIDFSEVIDIIFRNDDIKKLDMNKMRSFTLINEKYDFEGLFMKLLAKTNMNVKIFVLPQYKRHFKHVVDEFNRHFQKSIQSKRSHIRTNYGYQKRWVYNGIINFKHVISTPRVMKLADYNFDNSVALLVGAGPSLSYEFEKLKELSQQNNCYIFALGSAYRALLKHGVKADMIFTYDPTDMNQEVLSAYHEQEVDVPICFGSSVGFESIRKVNYENAYHMMISQDYFGRYLLGTPPEEVANDAPSVTMIALQMIRKIGFKHVVFVGQNFSYLDQKIYADGIHYERFEKVKIVSKSTVENVFGEEVATSSSFKQMLDILEQFVDVYADMSFVNTTKGGAKIKGAPYKALEDIVFEEYEKPVLIKEAIGPNDYDLGMAKSRFDDLMQERDQFIELLNNGIELIMKLRKQLDRGSIKNASILVQLEQNYNKMTKNLFFNVLISKLDRSYINIFESSIVEINRENDLTKKSNMIYSKMSTVYALFKKDVEELNKLFLYILEYIKWE
jgi:hypothetical protein